MEPSQITGTGVALVTPFLENGNIDFPALGRIIDHVIDGGVNYLVSLGTTGENPTLSEEEKKEIIRYTLDRAQGRVPVVVGIGGNDTREIIHCLETFPLDDALAVLSVSPYYSKPSAEGLFQHYKAVAANAPKPIILYNVPARTGRNIPADVTLRLAHEIPGIVAIKEASGDMVQCMQIIRDKPDGFTVVSGDDMLTLAQIAFGMKGVISVAGNYLAREMSSMVTAALAGRLEEARALHYTLMPALELMFRENNPAGVKAFMQLDGLCQNNLRLPLVPVSAALYADIRLWLDARSKG